MNTRKALLLLANACAATVLIAGCSSSGTTSTPASSSPPAASSPAGPTAGAVTMTLSEFQFSPTTAKPGQTVDVVNEDSAPHTVTIASADIDVGVPGGGTASFTAPATAGTYDLTCDLHPNMKGKLTVS